MSRNTVSRLVASDEPPRYERRPVGSQVEPFKASVRALLKEDADVAATVIRERLQQRGYAGGITILKEYLAKVRPQFKEARDYGRTTYLPGELLQADWWDTGVDVPVGKGVRRRAHGLVATLPFSDAHAVVFTHAQIGGHAAEAVPAVELDHAVLVDGAAIGILDAVPSRQRDPAAHHANDPFVPWKPGDGQKKPHMSAASRPEPP